METGEVRLLLDQFGKELESLKGRVLSIENWRTESAASDATILAKLDSQTEKIDTLTKKVDALEAKPADRWNSVVKTLITTAIGLLLGLVLKG